MVSLKKLFIVVLLGRALPLQCTIAKQEWLTVFVHGTLGLRANLSFETLMHFFRDNIEGSLYEKNVLAIRTKPFLFTMQPIQALGLHKVEANCSCPCASYVFAMLYNHLLKKYDPSAKNSYYTYGWSGLLSYNKRYQESRLLYIALREELQRLAQRGKYPKIRIVTYSHGGNLCLNLGLIRNKEFPQDTFSIDELSMIGMPVQYANACLICHPIFKRVFHFYSAGDQIQRLDLFSPCNFFSRKRFHGRLPEKLTQIEIKVTAPLTRVAGITLPANARGIVDQSPGHIELWFFGWTPKNYRRNLTFYPLPMATFIPYLVHTAQTCFAQERTLRFDIRPHIETTFVTGTINTCRKTVPFLQRSTLTALRCKALQFHPGNSNYVNCYLNLQKNIDPDQYQ